jgi:hypothetical protein
MIRNLFSKTGRNTTLAAIGLALLAAGQILNATFDGNPATVVDWKVTGAQLVAAWGLLKARDDGNGSAGTPVTP